VRYPTTAAEYRSRVAGDDEMFPIDHLEIIMLSVVAVMAVGAVVFTLVGTLTYLVFREPKGHAVAVPTVVPKAAAAREPEPVGMPPAVMAG
jgi:hypothetical protein